MQESFVDFPDPTEFPDSLDLVAVSAVDRNGIPLHATHPESIIAMTRYGTSYDPAVLMQAYRRGMFPMPLEVDGDAMAIGWWSPATRAVFYPDKIRITRSLRKSLRKFRVTFDTAFEQVVRQCGDPSRPQGWIDEDVINAYTEMFRQGHAHSVEVWNGKGDLVGGLYGVDVGGVFAGESMFHLERDASKVALVHLAILLRDGQERVIDTQWMTEHLKSLGAVAMPRAEYIALLRRLRDVPSIIWP